MKTQISYLTILLVAAFMVASVHAEENKRPEIGNKAPDFTLPDASGENHTLSDYEGKFVVLEWLNHECPFVLKHYATGNMQMLQESYRDKGVVWFSIISSAPGKQGYMEPDETRKVTREKQAKPSAVLLDPEGKVGRTYDARVTPHIYIIDPQGMLVYMGAIDDRPTTNHDDVEGARNFVSEALDLLLEGRDVDASTYQPYGCTVKY
ncbi:MAG: thioredoxin family protein [Cyclonatronaceae bacterium]